MLSGFQLKKLIAFPFLITCLFGFNFQSYAQAYTINDNVKRIVFLGNSITYGGRYIEYIDTYLTIKYPEKEYEIINVGLPSETVSGLSEPNHAGGRFPRPDLHERLERVLKNLKPDLVFACYGMNDGIYMPFNDFRFDKFKQGIKWLHDEVEKIGTEIIHVTPSVFDERKDKAYNNVMDIYSSWLISNRYSLKWTVIDTYWPMKNKLRELRLADNNFVFAEDGIHPNQQGHFLIAKHILLQLGETELTDVKSFDAFISTIKEGEQLLKLVEKKQWITKNAWLTHIGHKRPEMPKGLAIDIAQKKIEEIKEQIQNIEH